SGRRVHAQSANRADARRAGGSMTIVTGLPNGIASSRVSGSPDTPSTRSGVSRSSVPAATLPYRAAIHGSTYVSAAGTTARPVPFGSTTSTDPTPGGVRPSRRAGDGSTISAGPPPIRTDVPAPAISGRSMRTTSPPDDDPQAGTTEARLRSSAV